MTRLAAAGVDLDGLHTATTGPPCACAASGSTPAPSGRRPACSRISWPRRRGTAGAPRGPPGPGAAGPA